MLVEAQREEVRDQTTFKGEEGVDKEAGASGHQTITLEAQGVMSGQGVKEPAGKVRAHREAAA